MNTEAFIMTQRSDNVHIGDDVQSAGVSRVVLSLRGRGQLTITNTLILQPKRVGADT